MKKEILKKRQKTIVKDGKREGKKDIQIDKG